VKVLKGMEGKKKKEEFEIGRRREGKEENEE
jgi:hypothetical protein